MMMVMRHEHKCEERRLYVASDGFAYERPRADRVWRYPHDGGTTTADHAARKLEPAEMGEVWDEVATAWRDYLARESSAADRAGY